MRTVSVRAEPGTRWASLAGALGLEDAVVVAEHHGLTEAISDRTLVGRPPLVHGVTLRPEVAGEMLETTLAPVEVQITSGPDAGGTFPLRPGGRLTVGRDAWCDAVIDDPGISRHHLTISTTRRGILVEDGRSTNGTRVGGVLITEPTIWVPGVPLRVGASVLALVPAVATVSRAVPDGEGRLVVAPRTQAPPPLEPVDLTLPPRSTPTAPVAPGALGWLIPLAVSVLLAVALSMPTLLLFGLMAPAMALGSHVGERRRYRRECAAADEAHQQAAVAARESAVSAVALELQRREERSPDLARLIENSHRAGPLLWSRTTRDGITCRMGVATLSTTVSVEGEPRIAPLVPVEVDLSRGLSLVGPPAQTHALARSVLIQLAVLHPPGELAIEVVEGAEPRLLAVSRARWDWIAWLPHAEKGAGASCRVRLYDLTRAPGPVRAAGPVGPGPAGRADSTARPAVRVDRSVAEADDGRPSSIAIALCRTESQALDGTLAVAVDGSTLTLSTPSGPITGTADLLSLQRAHRAARALAPLSDGSAGASTASVPTSIDLRAVVGSITAEAITARWQEDPRATRFLLGRDSSATVALDLASDGPHALVAGTTGSGKSELLRTLVTSLALVNRPDELVMVLVDYKGGSAFAEAAALPHVVGVITDLDPHLADRALTSLTAELKRRERILAEAGLPDLPAYQGLAPAEPMPRLVLVIDEFRALAEELPEFLDGLVQIAALGRSLGVHLVLATQRPGGVISADVRANVNLRIALRVRDGSDSYDVIDSPAAADLPEGLPGRALIRTGADAPRTVQVASSSTPAPTGAGGQTHGTSVVPVHDLWSADQHATPELEDDEGTSALAHAIAGTTAAAARVGAVAPPSPWLPPLPEAVTLAELQERQEAITWGDLPLLLTDLPAQQRQPVHSWRPLTEGHLGISGAARTGRTTVVRSVLAGVLALPPATAHIYAFDLSGSLGTLAGAPHVGAVLAARDVARGCRVIQHLARLITERQQALAAGGYTSLAEQRERDTHPWPLVVLVIDGWPRFTELYGEADRGRPLELLLQVLREGLAVGVVAVVTGDRSLLAGRVAPLLGEMWSLRLTDSSDLLMAGLTRAQVPGRMPPGRAIRLRDGVVGQVAVLGSAEGAEQVAALSTLVESISDVPAGQGPRTFHPLPRSVTREAVQVPASQGLALGVGGDAAAPCEVPLPATGTGALGIIGPPGSGRTSALHTIEQSARARGWSVVSVDDALLQDARSLERHLEETQGAVLVAVDGFDRVTGTPAEDLILTWLDTPSPSDRQVTHLVAVTGEPDDLGGFRGLAARVARDRTGIVLQPTSAADGSGLGVAVPTGDEQVPGRGVLVARGVCTAVQVALPD